jgi:endothelin-converting enzyme/putative endopeptidase
VKRPFNTNPVFAVAMCAAFAGLLANGLAQQSSPKPAQPTAQRSLQQPPKAAAPQPSQAPEPLDEMPYSPSLNLNSMDTDVNPCVDFYQFSCGGWMRENPIPSDQAAWSVYAKLANDNQQFLWGILVADAKNTGTRTPIQQKVGDYFAACMDTRALGKPTDAPVLAQIARIGTLATPAALAAALPALQHDSLGNYFFRASTQQDAIDSSTIIVGIAAGGLGLPDRDYYLKTDPKSARIREAYLEYIQELFVLDGRTYEQGLKAANDILRIETALAKASLTRVELRDPHATYHMTPVDRLTALAPAIDWHALLTLNGAAKVTSVNVEQPAFLQAVQAELTHEPIDALRAYLSFHALSAAAPYLSKPFEQDYFDFYSTTLRGVPEMPPRWKTCTRAVDRNLGEALGQEFVRRTFTADTRDKVKLMTDQVETAMQQEIQGLTWMSAPTKAEALRKLHAIRNKIGYPDKWRDYSGLDVKPDDYFGNTLRAYQFEQARDWAKLGKPVDRDEWGMTPPTVNAYFDPQMNDINFPAGVLQPPLYDPKMDEAPNYGNTGATIGHELTHAFDDEGRQFDAKGNLRDWWTPADAKGFEQRISCLRDQYAGYTIVDDIHINSKLTSGEDVADLGGTLLAYIAWKKQLESPNVDLKSMSIVDGYTPDQRFFIGMAQWACENQRPENLRASAITNPHSPGFARINGVVSNMPEFQKAFACKAGQPMVHTPTCKVW